MISSRFRTDEENQFLKEHHEKIERARRNGKTIAKQALDNYKAQKQFEKLNKNNLQVTYKRLP